jgi:hypothetical protein
MKKPLCKTRREMELSMKPLLVVNMKANGPELLKMLFSTAKDLIGAESYLNRSMSLAEDLLN